MFDKLRVWVKSIHLMIAKLSTLVKSILLVALVSVLLIAILLIFFSALGWINWAERKGQIIEATIIGLGASLTASIFVTIAFTLIAERDFAKYVADTASSLAVDKVLKRLSMVPEAVYEACSTENPQFEERFNSDMGRSSFYFFFSVTAGYCSDRMNKLQSAGGLAGKHIRILVLNPTNPDLLEAHARKRLEQQLTEMPTAATLSDEVERFRKEIFRTVMRLYSLAIVHDIDLGFHDSFAFFRTELFESGLFLTFQRGKETFPGSVYYSRTTQVYDAYKRHHLFYQESSGFSLRKQMAEKKTLEDVLQGLGCELSPDELSK